MALLGALHGTPWLMTALICGGGLRLEDEFVRHKILDAVGDLALVGYPVIYRCGDQPAGGIHGPPFGPTSSGLPGGNTLSALART